MNVNAVRAAQVMQMQTSQANAKHAKGDKRAAKSEQKEKIKEMHQRRHKAIDASDNARKKMRRGAILGTIACPAIGTLIGRAIAGSVSADDVKDAQKLSELSTKSEIERTKAERSYREANSQVRDAEQEISGVEQFGEQIREAGRTAGF